MKKTALILIGVALVSAIIYLLRPASNVSRVMAQSDVQASESPVTAVQSNQHLRFDGLHANPVVQ